MMSASGMDVDGNLGLPLESPFSSSAPPTASPLAMSLHSHSFLDNTPPASPPPVSSIQQLRVNIALAHPTPRARSPHHVHMARAMSNSLPHAISHHHHHAVLGQHLSLSGSPSLSPSPHHSLSASPLPRTPPSASPKHKLTYPGLPYSRSASFFDPLKRRRISIDKPTTQDYDMTSTSSIASTSAASTPSSTTSLVSVSSASSAPLSAIHQPPSLEPFVPASAAPASEESSWPRSSLPVLPVAMPERYQRRGAMRRGSVSAESDRPDLAMMHIPSAIQEDPRAATRTPVAQTFRLASDPTSTPLRIASDDERSPEPTDPKTPLAPPRNLPLPGGPPPQPIDSPMHDPAPRGFSQSFHSFVPVSGPSDASSPPTHYPSTPLLSSSSSFHTSSVSPMHQLPSAAMCPPIPNLSSIASSSSSAPFSPSTSSVLSPHGISLAVLYASVPALASIPRYPKSRDTLARIHRAVFDSFLFSGLNQLQKTMVFEAMKAVHVRSGDTVCSQGEMGDTFFVIESGHFDALQRSGSGLRKIYQYSNSGSFGDVALMYNCPRAATVKARTDGTLWSIDGPTFRNIIIQSGTCQKLFVERFLETIPLLDRFSAEQRSQVADALEIVEFKDKEYVISQGGVSDRFYFVESGEALVTQSATLSSPEQEINRVHRGGYFGELGCITDRPRSANVIASGHLRCLVMSKSAFDTLMGDILLDMHRHAQHYVNIVQPPPPSPSPQLHSPFLPLGPFQPTGTFAGSHDSPGSFLAENLRKHFTL